MPFVSQAQRGYMYAHHPKMAKEWEDHTPEDADLPEHVSRMLAKKRVRSENENASGDKLVAKY